GFGRISVSSANLDPVPPARMPTFMFVPRAVRERDRAVERMPRAVLDYPKAAAGESARGLGQPGFRTSVIDREGVYITSHCTRKELSSALRAGRGCRAQRLRAGVPTAAPSFRRRRSARLRQTA